MIKNLLIVESPAKAKTIEKYLGKDFSVAASYGHIRDLPRGDDAVDIERGFLPKYEIPSDKTKVVRQLKDLARQSESIWLATDEDREGEAISWHLAEVLGLDVQTTRRIVFHEITKPAILHAIASPRTIDMNLVNAQQARRVLDRLVGFELSPILWRKVKAGLSAGRVQSVAVRLVVEREEEIRSFVPKAFFKINAQFRTHEPKVFGAELPRKFDAETDALHYLKRCINARFSVEKVQVKPGKRSPSAPFTTSTLQQEASNKLGFSVAATMRYAQNLYENGHITYMRTDSVNLSDAALAAAKKQIFDQFGERYHQSRTYKSKIANAQEAHEAIRPTDFAATVVSQDKGEQKLYELIWKRTLASQMADAILERTTATVAVLPADGIRDVEPLQAVGEVIKFDGFLRLYTSADDDAAVDEEILPPLSAGQELFLQRMTAVEGFTHHPPRYNEAALVKKLEELGIGRPSTYAPTISTIQKREYVVKDNREGVVRTYRQHTLSDGEIHSTRLNEKTGVEKNKLFPTDLGILVTRFLVQHFPDIVEYSFTAKVEEEFDEISRGKLHWQKMLAAFYPPFHEKVLKTAEAAERVSGERWVGTDPATGKPIIARLGKFGPIVQIGAADDPEKKFAGLRPGQRLDAITVADALELFKLPRTVGVYEGVEIKSNFGRFGPYLLHKNAFYSLPKGLDPFNVDESRAIEIIEAKRRADSEKIIHSFNDGEFVVRKARWGPVIVYKSENIKIPKGIEPEQLTLERCREIAEAHIALVAPKTAKKTSVKKTADKKEKTGRAASTSNRANDNHNDEAPSPPVKKPSAQGAKGGRGKAKRAE
jgi:DNA topoisomerase-1